jgi:hypothetical protein
MIPTEGELNHCPVCKSKDITYTDTFMDGSIPVSCYECDARWFEVWEYKGYEMI